MSEPTLKEIAELRAGMAVADASTSDTWDLNLTQDFIVGLLDLAERALKQPRMTREQVERLYRLALVVSGPETFAALLLELGIEIEPAPPEAKV